MGLAAVVWEWGWSASQQGQLWVGEQLGMCTSLIKRS